MVTEMLPTTEVEIPVITASVDVPEMVVYYSYQTANKGQVIIVVSFYAEPVSWESAVEEVQNVIQTQHPGKTVIISDQANDN